MPTNSGAVLSSWKEIAAYLTKGVRTVQRWERELGLPVRRPVGHNRRIVIAVPAELDGWIREQMPRTAGKRHVAPPQALSRTLQSQVTRLLETVAHVHSNAVEGRGAGAGAVMTELRVGLTFVKVALEARAGSEKRVRNRIQARKAYDTIVKFRNRFSFTPADEQAINAGLAQLKSALEQLGDFF